MNPRTFRQHIARTVARLGPGGIRCQRALAERIEGVHQATEEVKAVMEVLPDTFLKFGSNLEAAAEISRDQLIHCEALISLALGQGGGEIMIDAAGDRIAKTIKFVENTDRQIEHFIDLLSASNDQITRTLTMEEGFRRTMAPLTYVQTLFRIESACLPQHLQEMFRSLVLEIDRIRQRVEMGFKEKFQLIREVQAILIRSVDQLARQQVTARSAVLSLRTHMTGSLAAMKDSYEKNRDRDTRLSKNSQAVNEETEKVVMALQYQDIINQKFQQTLGVLREIDEAHGRFQLNPWGEGRSLRFIEQGATIMGAQLKAMSAELGRAGDEVCGSMNRIMDLMKTLDMDCVALRDLETVTAGMDGAVQVLLDSLADVRQLVHMAGQHATDAHTAIEPLGGMATNFTSFMRELSLEIQLIGLNAEVQADHIGKGTGLEVLSAQTSSISRETSRLSEIIAMELDGVTSGLAQVVFSFREIRDQSLAFGRSLDTDVASDEAALHDYRDSALKVLHHIASRFPELEGHTRAALQNSNFSAMVAVEIAALQAAVQELAREAHAFAETTGVGAESDGLTNHLLETYTMRSQVDIHRGSLQLPETGEPAAPAQPAQIAAGDVDLFEDLVPAAAPEPAAGANPSAGPENDKEAGGRADSSCEGPTDPA